MFILINIMLIKHPYMMQLYFCCEFFKFLDQSSNLIDMVSNFKINQKDHQTNNNKCCLFIYITTPKHDFHDYKNMTKQSNRTCRVCHFEISDNKNDINNMFDLIPIVFL